MSYTRDESPLSDEAQKVLHLAAERLREHPAAYNQGTFFSVSELPGLPTSEAMRDNEISQWQETMVNPSCGTTACLAGHIALAAGIPYTIYEGNWIATASAAAELDRDAACKLFSGNANDWPAPYRTMWNHAYHNDHEEGLARVAADLLDDLADGVVRWDDAQQRFTRYGE